MQWKVVAGEEVYEEIQIRKKYYECNSDENLCNTQIQLRKEGFVEAEIVKSIYGYGLRYASGLDNFAIIQSGKVLGSLQNAVNAAKAWCAEQPEKRYVRLFVEK